MIRYRWRFIHAFIAVTEHEELPSTGPMLYRSRSVVSNPLFRWFWWNMNFHAEHHTWPVIPWHQLPAAHEEAKKANVLTEIGYIDFFMKKMGIGGLAHF